MSSGEAWLAGGPWAGFLSKIVAATKFDRQVGPGAPYGSLTESVAHLPLRGGWRKDGRPVTFRAPNLTESTLMGREFRGMRI